MDKVGFTQPLCDQCWAAWSLGFHGDIRSPVRVQDGSVASCCLCASDTSSGIYFRVDPKKVPFPQEESNG